MFEITLAIISFFVLMLFAIKEALAWTNLTPSSSSFYTSNMLPDYEDPGTTQYFSKLAENTGYNFNQCTNVLPHKRIYISEQTFAVSEELTFDTDHNWTSENIAIIVQPSSSAYWSSTQYSCRLTRCLTLGSSYVELYRHDNGGGPDYDFDIKYEGSAGFTIRNNIAASRTLTVMIIQGSLHAGA